MASKDPDRLGRTSLHHAAGEGDLDGVKKALEEGIDINALANGSIGTALCCACEKNHSEIVYYLMKHKPNIHLCTKVDRTTAFLKAVSAASQPIVELLLEAEANIYTIDSTGKNAFHHAALAGSASILALLFTQDFKSHFMALDSNKMSPLHHATSVDVVSLLLAHGADIDCPDKNGMTPLLRACFNGNVPVACYLIEEKADVHKKDTSGNNSLHWACLKGSTESISCLLAAGLEASFTGTENKKYATPLQLAARSGENKAVEKLLSASCNMNETDCAGNTVLHAACLGKNGVVNAEMVLSLLQRGMDHNTQNKEGFTAIEKGLDGRDESFGYQVFEKVICSSLARKVTSDILFKIVRHSSFLPDAMIHPEQSALGICISEGFYDVGELLIERGANYLLPLEDLPARIFGLSDEPIHHVLIDMICSVRVINLSRCNLKRIPETLIRKLTAMQDDGIRANKILDVSMNQLQNIPFVIWKLSKVITNVKVEGNPLSFIPEGSRTSWLKIQSYYRHLEKRAQHWSEVKLMFVGEEGTGKSTLLRSLKTKRGKTKCNKNISTNGIEIHKGIAFRSTAGNENALELSFNAWDFGGQEIFYPTHQFFLTKSSVYILVFNTAEFQRDRVEYWMWQIRTKAGTAKPASIFVVGTHTDMLKKTEEDLFYTENEIKKQFPPQRFAGLRGVFFVSCKLGTGIHELKESIIDVVVGQKLIPSISPACLQLLNLLERRVLHNKLKLPYVKYSEFSEWISSCYIPCEEREACIHFLSESGRIVSLHQPDDIDKGLVILDPLWLATLMGNFLTFKHTWVSKGILHESHIKQVLVDYREDIHLSLINMLKKFNILYPLMTCDPLGTNDKPCSFIIPSMLPLSFSDGDIMKHWVVPFVMTHPTSYGRNYWFSFLPHGLISRLIVRLLHLPNVVGVCFCNSGVVLQYKEQVAMIQYFPALYKLCILVRVPSHSEQSGIFFRWMVTITDTLLEDSFQMKRAFRRTIPCTHCLDLAGVQGTTKDEPFEFTFLECVQAITSKRTSLFCNHIHSSSREVTLSTLAPDIAFADIPIINPKDIEVGKEIAAGAFGIVYKGFLRQQGHSYRPVAVKRLQQARSQGGLEDLFCSFQQEASIMSTLHHPFLVQLIGVSLYPNIQIILEYLPCGTLFSFLHPTEDKKEEKECDSLFLDSIACQAFPWPLRLSILCDIARGLLYLHSQTPAIIHRDIRTPNIFMASLSEKSLVRAKVADFGLSRFVAPHTEGALNTWEWMAPETLEKGTYTLSADVYSFGIICWEVGSRSFPFDEYYDDPRFLCGSTSSLPTLDIVKIKKSIIYDDLRPSLSFLDDSTPPSFSSLLSSCLLGDPTLRPSFQHIVNQLEDLLCSFPCGSGEDLYPDPNPNPHPHLRPNPEELLKPADMESNCAVQEMVECEKVRKSSSGGGWNNAYVEEYKVKGNIRLDSYPATILHHTEGTNKVWIGCRDGSILIADHQLKNFEYRWKAHEYAVSAIVSVGTTVWSAAVGGCVRVWDMKEMVELHECNAFRLEAAAIKQLIVTPPHTPNGSSLIWGSSPQHNQLFLWDVSSLELLHYLTLPENVHVTRLYHCELTLDNILTPVVLAGDTQGTIHLIHAITLEYYASWCAFEGQPISGMIKSNTSEEIWSSARNSTYLKIWCMDGNEMMLENTIATQSIGGIQSLHMNNVTSSICVCSGSSMVSYGVSSQKPVQELAKHEDRISSIYANKNFIYSNSRDGWIFYWVKLIKFHTVIRNEKEPTSIRRDELYAKMREKAKYPLCPPPPIIVSDNMPIVSPVKKRRKAPVRSGSPNARRKAPVRSTSSSPSSSPDVHMNPSSSPSE